MPQILILYYTLFIKLYNECSFLALDIPEPTGPGDTLLLPTLPYISEPAVRSFTHSGDHLYDEDLDLSLSVPPGTVSENETLKLKVGACCYGPFSVPDRYLVITAFYCIVASQKLQKPVKVEMGHCLLMPEYQKSRSVSVFLKLTIKESPLQINTSLSFSHILRFQVTDPIFPLQSKTFASSVVLWSRTQRNKAHNHPFQW